MARGVNKVILVGNVGADPETRRIPASGSMVTNINLATSDVWRDRNSGEQKERTEWHRVVFFGRLAEVVAEHVRKGAQLYVEGSLVTRKWQDNGGNDRYTTEVKAADMRMLGGRGGSSGRSSEHGHRDASRGSGGAPSHQPDSGNGGGGFPDDDIPFAEYQKGWLA